MALTYYIKQTAINIQDHGDRCRSNHYHKRFFSRKQIGIHKINAAFEIEKGNKRFWNAKNTQLYSSVLQNSHILLTRERD